MVLPTNIDSTYADDGSDASVQAHQAHHDTVHGAVNALAGGTAGQVWQKTSSADYAASWQRFGALSNLWLPTDYTSWLGWSFDPQLASGSITPSSARIYTARMWVPQNTTISNVLFYVSTGSSPTNTYVAVYSSAGARLGVSADISSSVSGVGLKTGALTSAVAVTGGPSVYVDLAFVSSTSPPSLSASPAANALSGAGTGVGSGRGQFVTGVNTTMPATLNANGSVFQAGQVPWMAVT